MRQTFLSMYTYYRHGQFQLTYTYTNYCKDYLKYDSSRTDEYRIVWIKFSRHNPQALHWKATSNHLFLCVYLDLNLRIQDNIVNF